MSQKSAETVESIVRKIEKNLDANPIVQVAYLFGSAAQGRLTHQSDLDIAVSGESPLSYNQKFEIISSLSKEISHEIDLIDLQVVSGPILQQALCTGRSVKKTSVSLLAALIKKMWYNQEDMMPLTKMILRNNCERFVHG